LINNTIDTIDPNGFNNTNIQKILLTIPNISNEMISSLINSLKPVMLKTGGKVNIFFYDSIYIENRIDLNCEKTFWFMRNKIFYNFFYEYDMINFLQDCKSKFQYENSIKKFDPNILFEQNYNTSSNKSNGAYKIFIYSIFSVILFIYTLIFIFTELRSKKRNIQIGIAKNDQVIELNENFSELKQNSQAKTQDEDTVI